VSLFFHSEDISFDLKFKRKTKKWIYTVISLYNRVPGNLNIIFCSDNYLLSINKQYLNHNYFTDVVTFDLSENTEISGDIFISIDKIKENAKEWNTTESNELLRVIIHGILHLLGFNDDTEENRENMRHLEDKALSLWED